MKQRVNILPVSLLLASVEILRSSTRHVRMMHILAVVVILNTTILILGRKQWYRGSYSSAGTHSLARQSLQKE